VDLQLMKTEVLHSFVSQERFKGHYRT